MHTYSQPRLVQRAMALVPLLYKGLQVKVSAEKGSPPRAIINLSDMDQSVWRDLFVSSLISASIDQPVLRASIHSYQRNITDYRKSNVIRALTILSLYEAQANSDSPFSAAQLIEMQSRLALTEKTFGGLVDKVRLSGFKEKETTAKRDNRGHNWELLRQQAEAAGLYFEPLALSDNDTTHVLLWMPAGPQPSKDSYADRPYNGRFLTSKTRGATSVYQNGRDTRKQNTSIPRIVLSPLRIREDER